MQAGRGSAVSNQKFDNALLSTVHHSPGSCELYREFGRSMPRYVQKLNFDSVWSILCIFPECPDNFALQHWYPLRRLQFVRESCDHCAGLFKGCKQECSNVWSFDCHRVYWRFLNRQFKRNGNKEVISGTRCHCVCFAYRDETETSSVWPRIA